MHSNHVLKVEFTREKANAETMTVPAVLSTEHPCQRNGFIEVLSHQTGSVDMSRFPLPVIESHDHSAVNIGIVENPQLSNGKLRGNVRFGQSSRAKELFADIQAGVITNLSIGYDWLEYSENDTSIIVVTKWQPVELSIVSIPADPTAGFFRGKNMQAQTQTPQSTHQTPPTPVNNDPRAEFQRQESERRGAIRTILSPFADRYPDVMQRAMDDMSITPEQASKMMLKAAGENLQPIGVHLAHDEVHMRGDNIRSAIADGLLLRSGIKVAKPHVAARDFARMGIAEISTILLRQSGKSCAGLSNQDLITRAMSTSDLPYLLANMANKAMMIGFENSAQSHDLFANFVDVQDFKTQSRIALSAFESLSAVTELGEVTFSSLSDAQETYVINSYQKAIAFSRQSLINDDLQQLTLVPEKLGTAARRTEADLVYSIFNNNPNMADDVPLFDASRGNLLTGAALSVESLAAAVAVLRKAKDISGNGYLGVKPRWLIVGPDLEITALQVLASLTNVNSSATAIPSSDMARLEVIVEPRISSATAWFLLGEGVETIEVGRLSSSFGGGISFENDQDFGTDAYRYKVRLDAGAKALSAVGMVKNPGA